MAKITRKAAKIFGSTASTNQIAKFGSLAAASPVRYSGATADPDNIQALGNWLTGWFAGVEGANSPAIEDLNAFCFVMAYQIAYQMQEGVAEWNSATTYYIGSVANDAANKKLYVSLTDNNLNNAVSDPANWSPLPDSIGTQMTSVGANAVAASRTRSTGATVAVGGVAISSSSASFSTSSASPVDVTNLTVTITTSGRPVMLMLVPDGTASNALVAVSIGSSAALTGLVYFLRASSVISKQELNIVATNFSSNLTSTIPPSSFSFIDIVAAGTYTYKVQGLMSGGGALSVLNTVLMAYEL